MDMLNRLKSTVTMVTNALPSNPLTREFDIGAQRASAGPGLMWKIHDGLKRSTKQEVSVWVFEKRSLEPYTHTDRQLITDALKKGVSQLTRLRHPRILSVLQPLEESRDTLTFTTEPVFASLANILGHHGNLPSPVPTDIKQHELYDVEIKYGLLQITEGLSFLHNDVKLIHSNICPEAIIVNHKGAWKIAGFDFCIINSNPPEQASYYAAAKWDGSLPTLIQPPLNYLAPEHAAGDTWGVSADMFSLGILFYAVFSSGCPPVDFQQQYAAFRRHASELKRQKTVNVRCVPDEARDHVKMLLCAEPSLRPDADQLTKIPFFNDVGAMTLQYLDNLFQQDNLQKSQFFKGLAKVIQKLPTRVCLHRVLPSLQAECLNVDMVPFLLPNILLIGERVTDDEFVTLVLPPLLPLLRVDEPVQISLIFLQHMSLLLKKTPSRQIHDHVLPMVYRALETSAPQIQELCLTIIPTFASLIEYSSMKSCLVPRVKALCLHTSSLGIRVTSLVCLGKLLEFMDKWFVLDEILPILQEVTSREPAVLMSMLGIFKVAMTHKKLGITKDVLANQVLPFMIRLCIDNNLNLQQFNAFMSLIKEMTEKVETEHRSKLQQLDSMQQEQRTLQLSADTSTNGPRCQQGQEVKHDTMMDTFLSGFNLFGSHNPTPGANNPTPGANNPTPGANNRTAGANNRTAGMPDVSRPSAELPSQQKTRSQVAPPLTLEEKQQLSLKLDQQRLLNTQHALQPAHLLSTATGAAPSLTDLSATLRSSHDDRMTMGGAKGGGAKVGGDAMGGLTVGGSKMGGAKMGGATIGATGISGQKMTDIKVGGVGINCSGMGRARMGGTAMGGAVMGGTEMGEAGMGVTGMRGAGMGGTGLGEAGMGVTGMGGTGMGGIGMGTGMGGAGMGGTGMRGTGMGGVGIGGTGMEGAAMGGTGMGGAGMGWAGISGAEMGTMGQLGMIGTIGTTSTMGNRGTMGNQGMMGNQSMMGNQGVIGNQGSVGNLGMMGNNSFSTGMSATQTIGMPTNQKTLSGHSLSNQDIADFLG